jgi:hypothetical protein
MGHSRRFDRTTATSDLRRCTDILKKGGQDRFGSRIDFASSPLVRPLMAIKPAASMVTMSPGVVPAFGERLQHAGLFRTEISQHDAGPAHRQTSAFPNFVE